MHPESSMRQDRCRAALQSGGSGLQVDEVILPDGEQYKSLEVLQKVTPPACHMAPLHAIRSLLFSHVCQCCLPSTRGLA